MINTKLFRIGDLFNVETGKDLIYSFLSPGKYNVIGHGIENNGITATTNFLDSYKLYDPSSTIALANRGNFYASVQIKEFYIGTRVKALTAKFNSNKYILMYIATIINKERFRYSYGRNACDKIEEIMIKLPSKLQNPDFEYMEEFIKKMCNEELLRTKSKSNIQIKNVDSWEDFYLSSLFKFERGTRLIELDRESGQTPFITAGFLNEGISENIKNDELKLYNNALTIDMFGNCFYRNYDFYCDDNILVLKNDKLNKYSYLFIATIINQDKYRYNYGRQYRQKDFLKHKIKLPALNGKPDYNFMSLYMKSLLYSDKI